MLHFRQRWCLSSHRPSDHGFEGIHHGLACNCALIRCKEKAGVEMEKAGVEMEKAGVEMEKAGAQGGKRSFALTAPMACPLAGC